MQISTIGIDLAKNVFQVHGVDAEGKVVLVRQLRRGQMMTFLAKLEPCLIGMEACATSHHWAREITKLGHEVKLIPPAYVKAYVKRQKNDAADAAAICEAVTRPSMRFVPVKSAEQQSTLAMHRTRNLLISQRTQLINALRAHLAELGIVAEKGRDGLARLIAILKDEATLQSLPAAMLQALRAMVAALAALQTQVAELDRSIRDQHRASDVSRRLKTVPSIGLLGATALTATSQIQVHSSPAATSQPGSVSYRSRTRPAARSGSAASVNRATGICAASWSLAPRPSFSMRVASRKSIPGSRSCWPGSQRKSSRSPLPIRRRGSLG